MPKVNDIKGSYSFQNCTNLVDAKFSPNLSSIAYEAFYNCYSLQNADFISSAVRIGGYAFYKCDGLTSVSLPRTLTSIGEHAFYNCDGLVSVSVCCNIGNTDIFNNCSNLKNAFFSDGVSGVAPNMFMSCSSLSSV